MGDTWEVLERAGVPMGAARPRGAVLDQRLREELRALADHPERLDATLRQALFAWLCALEHHWPSRFDAVAGPGGRALLDAITTMAIDPNRHVKLRRIAIDNLAARL